MKLSLPYLIYLTLVFVITTLSQIQYYVSLPSWIIWSGVGLALLPQKDDFALRINYMAITMVSILLVTLGFYFSKTISFLPSLYIVIIILISAAIYQKHRDTLPYLFLVNLILLAENTNYTAIELLPAQMMMLATGSCTAILLQFIFYFNFVNYQNKNRQYEMFYALQQFSQQIFASLIDRNYTEQTYLFEHRIHDARQNCLRALQRLSDNSDQFKALYSSLLSIAQLRIRESDRATLVMIVNELEQIGAQIDLMFADLIARKKTVTYQISLNKYAQAVAGLEDVYHNVLQVAAKEPLIYLLLIADLQLLKARLQEATYAK